MSFLPVGFAECTAVFTIPGQSGPANVVTGHDVSGLATSLAVIDAIDDGWDAATPLTNWLASVVSLVALDVRWQAAPGDPVSISRTKSQPGAVGTAATSPQVTYLLQKISGFAGRKNRGRMYLPGVVEASVSDGGVVLPATVTNLAATAAAALSNWNTSGAPLHILHTDPADTPREVVELAVSPIVATQRRRLR